MKFFEQKYPFNGFNVYFIEFLYAQTSINHAFADSTAGFSTFAQSQTEIAAPHAYAPLD